LAAGKGHGFLGRSDKASGDYSSQPVIRVV
jgi:hypothetical protein